MFFILFVIVVPIYALNIHDGIRAMSKEWLEMCESFRPTRLQVLRFLIIPHVIPYVLMTTKSTVGYATRMLIFAELIGSSLGIGARMGLAQATFHMDSVIAWTVMLVVINVLAQSSVGLAERLSGAARDIGGITANRWSHGYALENMRAWNKFWPDGPPPSPFVRRPTWQTLQAAGVPMRLVAESADKVVVARR